MTVMEGNELISNIKLKPVEEAGSSLFNIVDSRAFRYISISSCSGSGIHFSEEKLVVSFIAMR
jgi:hypothetical protein